MATVTAGPRHELRMLVGYGLMPPTAGLLAAAVFWDVPPASDPLVAGGQLAMAIAAAIVSVPITVFDPRHRTRRAVLTAGLNAPRGRCDAG